MRRRTALYIVLLLAFTASFPVFPGRAQQQENINEKEELDFAEGLFSRGMYDMAIEGYKKFLGDHPESRFTELANYRIGESLFLGKDYNGALTWFDGFLKKYPSGDFALRTGLRQGQIYLMLEDYAAAEKKLLEMSGKKQDPDLASAALYYLARVYLEEEKYREATDAFDRLIKEYPGNEYTAFAYMNLGDIYLRTQDFDNAADSFQAARALDVSSVHAQAELRTGDAYYLAGDLEKARTFFGKAMALSPDGASAENAALGIISSYYNEGKYGDVTASCRELMPKIQTGSVKAQVLFLWGNSLFYGNDFKEAEKVYHRLAAEFPDSPYGKKAVLNETWALLRSGDSKKSLETIDSFLARATEQKDEALYIKGKLLYESGDEGAAIDNYKKLMKEFPGSPFYKEALFETGLMHDIAGDNPAAEKAYSEFLTRFPDDNRSPQMLLKIGQNHLKAKDLEGAENKYKEFLSKYGTSPLKENALYQLGNVYIQRADFGSLITTYEQFLKEYPDSLVADSASYWAGRAYQEKGEWDKALAYYARGSADKESDFYPLCQEGAAYCLYRKEDDAGAALKSYELMVDNPDFQLTEDVYRWVADHYFKNGQSERSLEVIELHEKYYPEADLDGVLSFMSAENLRMLGQLDEAEKYYRDVIKQEEVSPFIGRAYLGLGRLYAQKKDYDEALSNLAEALKFHDDNITSAFARFEIGNVKSETGNYEEAAKSYMMVAILFDDHELSPLSYFKAAEAFAKAGDAARSGEVLKELVEKYPDSTYAVQALEQLRGTSGEKD